MIINQLNNNRSFNNVVEDYHILNMISPEESVTVLVLADRLNMAMTIHTLERRLRILCMQGILGAYRAGYLGIQKGGWCYHYYKLENRKNRSIPNAFAKSNGEEDR